MNLLFEKSGQSRSQAQWLAPIVPARLRREECPEFGLCCRTESQASMGYRNKMRRGEERRRERREEERRREGEYKVNKRPNSAV